MLVDLLMPVRCVVCGAGGAAVCAPCLGALPAVAPPLCERCGAPTAWPVRRCRECGGRRLAFASARAAVAYDGAVRRLVAGWKERGLRRLADVAAEVVVAALPPPAVDAITAVPADPERRLVRGHHPAAALTAALAERWRIPEAPLLVRPRGGPPQRGRTLAERRGNVAGAFVAVARPPPRIALVDDVYTTGATASAAASALRRAGARHVSVITFARTVRRS